MNEQHEAVYIISVAAELVGMHPQTLRVYERRGLVDPYRTPGGTRRYSQQDLNRLLFIQELSNAGVNLEGIKRIITLQNENTRLRNQVNRLRRLLAEAESRWGTNIGPAFRIGVHKKRNLPSIRRNDPFGL
ncbi:MAG: heat shock protein transcriptional repressor HspR [Acidimicrobiia bacterium]